MNTFRIMIKKEKKYSCKITKMNNIGEAFITVTSPHVENNTVTVSMWDVTRVEEEGITILLDTVNKRLYIDTGVKMYTIIKDTMVKRTKFNFTNWWLDFIVKHKLGKKFLEFILNAHASFEHIDEGPLYKIVSSNGDESVPGDVHDTVYERLMGIVVVNRGVGAHINVLVLNIDNGKPYDKTKDYPVLGIGLFSNIPNANEKGVFIHNDNWEVLK